jgi:predicted dehydrogenase
MNFGVIGCGTMGKMYMERLCTMPDVQLTAISNRSEDVLAECASKYGVTAYTSYDELIASSEVDVVCITLPTHMHKEVVLKAAASGKHVICEKPLALNPQDAREMAEACERNGVRFFPAHVLRFFPEYVQLRQKVKDGTIGKVGVAHAKRASKHPVAGSWYIDPARSGGILFDLMIHDLDFLRWTLGDAKTVFAVNQQAEGVDYASVTIRFESGAIANLEAFWGYPGPFLTQVELAGTQGVLRHDSRNSVSLIVQRNDPEHSAHRGVDFPMRPSLKDPFVVQLEHFLNCIRTGEEAVVTSQDGVSAVELAHSAVQSLQTGQPVRIAGHTVGEVAR